MLSTEKLVEKLLGKLHSRPSGTKGGFVEDFKFCSEFVSVVTEV